MFDVTKFIERNNWTIEDLAARLFGKGGKSRVGMWKTGDSSPRYAQILALIDLGVTAEELFGKEHADKLLQNSSVLPQLPSEITNDPGFTIGQKIVGGRAKAKPFGLAGLQYIESKIKV